MSKAIKDGDVIRVHYTGHDENGQVFDTTAERGPFTFMVGAGALVRGVDEAVCGMHAGERKSVTVSVDMAYGERREDYLFSVSRGCMPGRLRLATGMQLKVPLQGGQTVAATIVAMDEQNIRLDANHPLAGQRLRFDIEIVETGLKPADLFQELPGGS
jgi:peptidylprolyl isomerase